MKNAPVRSTIKEKKKQIGSKEDEQEYEKYPKYKSQEVYFSPTISKKEIQIPPIQQKPKELILSKIPQLLPSPTKKLNKSSQISPRLKADKVLQNENILKNNSQFKIEDHLIIMSKGEGDSYQQIDSEEEEDELINNNDSDDDSIVNDANNEFPQNNQNEINKTNTNEKKPENNDNGNNQKLTSINSLGHINKFPTLANNPFTPNNENNNITNTPNKNMNREIKKDSIFNNRNNNNINSKNLILNESNKTDIHNNNIEKTINTNNDNNNDNKNNNNENHLNHPKEKVINSESKINHSKEKILMKETEHLNNIPNSENKKKEDNETKPKTLRKHVKKNTKTNQKNSLPKSTSSNLENFKKKNTVQTNLPMNHNLNNTLKPKHSEPTPLGLNNMINDKVVSSKNSKNSKDSKDSQNEKEKNKDNAYRNLLLLAKKGDKETFLHVLGQILSTPNGNINYKDDIGYTALHYACDEGNLKIVNILLNANCNPNIQADNKKIALHLATIRGYFDISKLLLEYGSSINAMDDEKNTPLHYTAINGHIELLKFLLEKLPSANAKNIYGKTPLDVAKNDEIKTILTDYLSKKENVYHTIKIPHTSESTCCVMMKKFMNPTNSKFMFKNTENNININIQTNFNNNNINNTINNSLSRKNNLLINSAKNKKGISSSSNISNKNFLTNLSGNKKINILTKNFSNQKNNLINNFNINNFSMNSNSIKNFSKKNSISNFSINSLLSNRKLNTTTTTNETEIHKTKTLQKFDIHNNNTIHNTINNTHNNNNIPRTANSKNKNKIPNHISSLNGNKVPNSNNNSNKKNPNNISIDNNNNDPFYRLNKTEEIAYKPYKTIPDDISNEENLYSQINLNSIEEERITPTSFICLGMLGKGSFGEVYLVQKTNNQMYYAMKVLSKDRIMGQNLMKYAMAERNVLSLTNHPFIVKLNFAFQTNHKLFLILDYCSGGDLSKQLQYEKRFSEERAKFYICEVLLALEDLHKRDIIFRDLKPDNVVLDDEGHAKLTDFGLSKEGVFDSQCAKSFCGSIAYLAPEMLKKQGHGKAVDWYLLGVLFYEMIVGIPPYFTDQKEDIFRNIECGELIIPKIVSKEAAELLKALLERDPSKRLGGGPRDALEIKEHKYFKNVNWDDVYNKAIPPPKTKNYKNKILKMYNHPKLFQPDNLDYQNSNILPGWSFINNEEF